MNFEVNTVKRMKTITERHEFILRKLQENGKVNIPELSDEMQVSGVTIRKDLKLLEEKNLNAARNVRESVKAGRT